MHTVTVHEIHTCHCNYLANQPRNDAACVCSLNGNKFLRLHMTWQTVSRPAVRVAYLAGVNICAVPRFTCFNGHKSLLSFRMREGGGGELMRKGRLVSPSVSLLLSKRKEWTLKRIFIHALFVIIARVKKV